jgi:hypothetical protein
MSLKNLITITLLGLGTSALGCAGGSDTAISGFGNGHNIIGGAAVLERAARELAALGAIPEVTDEDLRNVFDSIRARAIEGEPDAVLLMVRVAALQRESE